MKKVYLAPEISISNLDAKDILMVSNENDWEWETSDNEAGIF